MKRRRFYKLFCAFLIAVACLFSGCGATTNGVQETSLVEDAGAYVYYQAGDGYQLTMVACELLAEDLESQVSELYEKLKSPEDSQYAAAVPESLQLLSFTLDGTTLSMNFSSDYTSMSATDEVLCRAAIVNTMMQLEEVEGVSFLVADQPLVTSSGSTIGVMTSDSFELSVNQTLNETELTLYFTDETGQWLKSEQRTVVYRSGQSLEKLVVEELIDGPSEDDNYPVLDSSLSLTGISVTDGICYVYFDSSFLQNTLEVADYIPIYAIVNSLSELSGISRVQFVIDGSQDAVFRESISLSSALSMDLNYIYQE